MRLEHKSLGVSAELQDELLQKHVEAYFEALRELGVEKYFDQSTPHRLGNYVRAACQAGILNTVHAEDVDSMKPAAVAWLAQKLDKHIAEALEVPPE